MPDGSGKIGKFEIDNTQPAHKNPDFMAGFTHMLLVSRRASEFSNDHELAMIQEAMRHMAPPPSPLEVYQAFWKAYGDKYTPAEGIQWRQLAHYIQEARNLSYGATLDAGESQALKLKQQQYGEKNELTK